ncbi:MAG: subclass B3 metallo-beta-lactamase [Chitinophagaceae bacterium]
MIFRKVYLAALAILATSHIAVSQALRKDLYNNPDWIQETAPFRIAGNVYYVGTYDLGCYLIVTNQGNILVNTGSNNSAPIIKKNIEKLGFQYKDTKILLTRQVHYDHVGGIAQMKKETKAKLMIEAGDVQVMEDGGVSDFIFGGKGMLFYPAKVDRILHNMDTVQLGDTQLLVLHHPGHTKGATSYLLETKDERKTYKILIANMPSVLDDMNLRHMDAYPNIGKDYAYTYDTMPKIQFNLWVAAHASQFGLHEKHKPNSPYNPDAFNDRTGYEKELGEMKQYYLEKLAKDQSK